MSMKRVVGLFLLVFAPLLLAVTVCADAPPWPVGFAADLHAARVANAPVPQLSKVHPDATLADAYAVQALYVEQLLADGAIGGFKSAVVGADGQAALGIEGPLVAVVPASGVLYAKDNVAIDLASEPRRMLETEIGYVFGQGISAALPDVEALKKHVKSVVPVIEVPGGSSQNEVPVTAGDLVARNIDSMAVIIGLKEEPQAVNVDAVDITFTHNGVVVNTARGGTAAGGQWETLLKTVNALVSLGYTIEAGQFITNGALGKIVPAAPGGYSANFGPLGTIEFTVVDSRPTE